MLDHVPITKAWEGEAQRQQSSTVRGPSGVNDHRCIIWKGGGLGWTTRHPTKTNGLYVVLQWVEVKDGAGVCPPHLQVFREDNRVLQQHGCSRTRRRGRESPRGRLYVSFTRKQPIAWAPSGGLTDPLWCLLVACPAPSTVGGILCCNRSPPSSDWPAGSDPCKDFLGLVHIPVHVSAQSPRGTWPVRRNTHQ